MNVEERLRAAVHAATDHIRPDEVAGLAVVRARGRAARRRRGAVLGGAAGALVLTATAVAVTRFVDDDSQTLVLSRGPSTTAADSTAGAPSATTPASPEAPAPTTTPTAAPATPPASVFDQVIWPGPGQLPFDDAVSAAGSFVEEFVGLDDPPLGEFRATGPDLGAVDVYGRTESGEVHDRVVSTISLQRFAGHWFVTGAAAGDLHIDQPAPGAEVTSPVRVEGRGRGFEGTVVVEVRDAFQPAGETLGQQVTIAGCCEDLVPFNALVAISAPAAPRGVILARTDTGMERGMVDFTAIPVRFATATTETGEVTTLRVFFTELTDGGPVGLVAVERTVPKTTGVLRASLVALLDGPTDEEAAAGLVSWFRADAGGAVDGVNLSEGRATVRLSSRLAEPDGAPPADEVIAELNATAFQFANVDVVRYELDGSCEAFDAWLNRGCEFTRGAGSLPPSARPPVEGTSPPSLEGASTTAVMVPPTGCCDPGPFVLLTNVTAQHQPGFDRIVFEFSFPVVNYHVRYVPLPVRQDPSDLPVVLQGDSALQISMGATGTDQTVIPARETYSGPLRLAVGTGAVIELVQTGDFEAVSNWAVGLRGQPPFRVSTESNPSRLIIDIASQ